MTQVTPTRNLKGYLEPDQLGIYETQLQDIERQLKVIEREQHQFSLCGHNRHLFPFALRVEATKR